MTEHESLHGARRSVGTVRVSPGSGTSADLAEGVPGRGAHGHDGHAGGPGGHVERFRRLFWGSLVLTVPVVVLSPMFALLLGYELPTGGVVVWVPPVLGTVLFVWGGSPFLGGAVSELRARRPGMMLLIGLAITVAFVASWGATLGLLSHSLEFWWSWRC